MCVFVRVCVCLCVCVSIIHSISGELRLGDAGVPITFSIPPSSLAEVHLDDFVAYLNRQPGVLSAAFAPLTSSSSSSSSSSSRSLSVTYTPDITGARRISSLLSSPPPPSPPSPPPHTILTSSSQTLRSSTSVPYPAPPNPKPLACIPLPTGIHFCPRYSRAARLVARFTRHIHCIHIALHPPLSTPASYARDARRVLRNSSTHPRH